MANEELDEEDTRSVLIRDYLEHLKQRKSFGTGDSVVTLEGPLAHKELVVVKVRENGMVQIVKTPEIPTIEIKLHELYHIDDYHKAFEVALREEHQMKSRRPS